MDVFLEVFSSLTSGETWQRIRDFSLTLLIGLVVINIIRLLLSAMLKKRLQAQTLMVLQKGVLYSGLVLLGIPLLRSLGLDLSALLGAAGIAGIALGFASQTSVSNVISGFFLISEKPFAVGDLIQVGEVSGIVLSIDLLSVKIRTFDNRYIRFPNEKLLNTPLTNVTHFPIRRLDIPLRLEYRENLDRVKNVLEDVASNNAFALDEPAPLVILNGFGEYSLDVLFTLWFAKEDFVALKNSIFPEIRARFDAEGIRIALPRRVLSWQEEAALSREDREVELDSPPGRA